MVQAVAQAAGAEPGVILDLRRAADSGVAQLAQADGYIFATPENLGSMSGLMKDFFDRTYYGVLEEKQGMPYALYVRAGLDGTGTMRAVDSITTGLRWKPICDPLLCKGDWNADFIDQAHDLGQLMATGLEAGVF